MVNAVGRLLLKQVLGCAKTAGNYVVELVGGGNCASGYLLGIDMAVRVDYKIGISFWYF